MNAISNVVFVLDNIADYPTLLNEMPENAAVHLLNADDNALQQMADVLANYNNLDAIHLFSHGSSGALDLGAYTLNSENLNEHSETLTQIGRALSPTGDILLYGCDVAQGETGLAFISKLATATQADIAASDTPTGHTAFQGDWTLEQLQGPIEAAVLAVEGWAGVLGTLQISGVPSSVSWDGFYKATASEFANVAAFAAIKADGSVVAWGYAPYGGTAPVGLTNVQQIFSSGTAFAALQSDGTLTMWGGVNGMLTQVKQVFSSDSVFAVLHTDNSLTLHKSTVSYGDTMPGGGGTDDAIGLSLTNIQRVFSSGDAFAALKTDGTLISWGRNQSYQSLATPDALKPGDAGTVKVKEVYSNLYAFVALTEENTLIAWGDQSYGGVIPNINATNIKTVYATNSAFAALKNDGTVIVWGDSSGGGFLSLSASVQLTQVKEIYSNQFAFAALKEDGTVVVWGNSGYGGSLLSTLSGVASIVSTDRGFAALTTNGQVWTWSGYAATATEQVSGGVKAIYASGTGFVALKTDGTVVGGGGSYAVPNNLTDVKEIYTTVTDGFAALKNDGSVVVWGNPYYGGSNNSGADLTNIISFANVATNDNVFYNAAPTINDVPSNIETINTIGEAVALNDFTVADADGDSFTVTLTTTNGTLNNLTDADTSTNGIQLTGSAATINNALASATFTATQGGAASIGISVTDGIAAPVTDTYEFDVNRAPVVKAPVTVAFEEVTYKVDSPRSVDSADLDGDGDLDVVVSNLAGSYNRSVLLNDGTGKLSEPTLYLGTASMFIDSVDVDGDGDADVITGGYNKISVSLNANGIFSPPVDVTVFPNSASSYIPFDSVDLDGDGDIDIAAINQATQTVAVLLNNGKGAFSVSHSIYSGDTAIAASIKGADVNNDGAIDIVTSSYNRQNVSVLLNKGTGTFSDAVSFGVGDQLRSLVSTDVNKDGNIDLITASASGKVSVLLGNGDGTFKNPVHYTASSGDTLYSVSSVDVNDDGSPDLLVGGARLLSVFINKGDGTFTESVQSTVRYAISIASADLNGDNKPDAVVADPIFGSVSVFSNVSTITKTAFTEQTAVAVNAGLVISDANGDTDWNGGTLKFQITNNPSTDDSLYLPSIATGNDSIWLDGTSIKAGNTVIGTASAATASSSTALTLTFNSDATSALVQAVARAVLFNNSSDTPNTFERTITLTVTDKHGNSTPIELPLTVAAVNDVPTIADVPSTAQVINKAGEAVALNDFTVADADGDSFTVTLTTTNGTLNNLTDADTSTNGIQLTGSAATINNALASATFTATQGGAASIGISVTDGVVTTPVTKSYNMQVNSAPTLSIAGAATEFTEQTAVVINSAIVISDVDGNSDWDGGSVKFAITNASSMSDGLFLPVVNPNNGGIWLDGTQIKAGNTVIGTTNSTYVTGSSEFTFTFNADATNELVQDTARAVLFNNSSDSPSTVARTITVTATDKQGNISTHTQTVNISAVNDAPIVSNSVGSKTANEETSIVFSASDFSFQDVDGDTLHSIKITQAPSAGVLFLDANKNGLKDVGETTVVADTIVNTADIGKLTFLPADNANGSNYANFAWTVNDGTANSTNSGVMTLNITNVNDAPAGTVSITGSAIQGETLTASNTLSDVDGLGTVSYQWFADGAAITDATASTFTLEQAQVGKAITVQASYTDGQNTPESVVSSATTAVQNVNDAPAGTVSITGSATQGETLTASNTLSDVDGLGTVSYQWFANQAAIENAVGDSFTLTQAQVGQHIHVVASYTDGAGTLEQVSSAPSELVQNINDLPTGHVTLSGTASLGEVLTAGHNLDDVDGLGVITYQWFADGVAIDGATGETFVLGEEQVGQHVSVQASYTDGQNTPESVVSSATTAVQNVNDAPAGVVSITGSAIQGETLTASNTLSDVDGLGTVSYQWFADGMAITDATASTLTLEQAQVGKAITVQASYTDGQNTPESVVSSATTAVQNVNDTPAGVVSITGSAIQGETLTASNTLSDVDGLGTVSYQWFADGAAITDATASTFTLEQAQVGKAITVQASYTDGQNTPESVVSSATTAVQNVNDTPAGVVSITGSAIQGETLTASNTLSDVDGLGTVSYQWFADGAAITDATASTLTLEQAQVGKAITVQASYTDGQNTPESVVSSATTAVQNVNDAPAGTVSITGSAIQGETLTASNTLSDVDGLGTVSYQWFADGMAITDATASTFTLEQAQVGKAITVQASYTDGQNTPESVVSSATTAVQNVNDAPAGTVSITGSATQGETLTASNTLSDVDGLGTVSYQWFADGAAITDATASTFTLEQAQVGKAITVQASYTDGQNTPESVVSSATTAVQNVNDTPAGVVSITGSATQGETLTASNTLSDVDGLGTVSYQWFADGAAITDATASTLTLEQAQVGKAITVQASYTDGQNTPESVVSSATTAVQNVNDTPAGVVSITGSAIQGQTLTASNTLSDVDGLGTVSYQWFANQAVIENAVGDSFTLTQAQVGQHIHVVASYTDGAGTLEQVSSAPSELVQNINDLPTGHVTLSGTASLGEVLTAGHNLDDVDGLGVITYQWFADGVAIDGATGETFVLGEEQVGQHVSVQASYTDGHGTVEHVSSPNSATVTAFNHVPSGTVTITGSATQGETLTASNTLSDVDGLGAVSYQWFANQAAIENAVGDSFTLTQAQVGQHIHVVASYTDGAGTLEQVSSAPSNEIININDLPSGGVTISGTLAQGETLTAQHTLSDLDGLGVITYQWFADGVAIDGATGETLTLTQAQVGARISVAASYTDKLGADEQVLGNTPDDVLNLNDLPVGQVLITGNIVQEQVLTARHTLSDVDGLGALSYQWLADGVAIDGATQARFTLEAEQVGKTISVMLTYTDNFGTREQVSSAETLAILPVGIIPELPTVDVWEELPDIDEDGIPELIESLVPNLDESIKRSGDGNGDGVNDTEQADVASLPFRNTMQVSQNPEADVLFVTLVSGSEEGSVREGSKTAIKSASQLDIPTNLPANLDMPLGMISFTATTETVGGSESFSLFVDDSLAVNGYWKQNAQGAWVNLASVGYGGQVVKLNGKTRLDFVIQDGGEFDEDGVANGVIVDPGAPGLRASSALVLGSVFSESLTGSDTSDVVVSLQNRDTLVGGSGNDVLLGGNPRDVYVWNDALGQGDLAAGSHDLLADRSGVLQFSQATLASLKINGETLYEYQGRPLMVGSQLDANNNIALVNGTLQLDVNGDGAFNAADDARITLHESTGLKFNAKTGLFTLTGNKPQLQTVDLIDINARLGTHTAETLSGDVSNNLLYGLAGRDTLAGGEGDDVLIGGKGRDLYTWAATDLTAGGHDVVLDGRGSLLRFDSLPVTSMQLNGISIDALTHRTQLGSSIDANNGMAWSSNQLRIDVNNDGLFSNAEDFSIQIVGNVTRVMYDAKHDLLVLS